MKPLIQILHLEDDLADAKLVQAILEEAGLACRITRVQTGEEFREALRQGGADVILADYRLPGYDGMAALRLVQEMGLDVPFIFVSGTMGEDAAIDGLTKGATDYVLKKKISRLAPAVKRALHEAENRRERQLAERSLAEQFKFLQLLIDSIPSPVFYKDANGIYQGCNQSLADFLGRPKEAIIGKTVFDTYPKEQAEEYFQMDQELFQHPGTQIYESVMERSDGTIRNFIFSKATFVDFSGKVAGLIGIMTDITERKQTEEAKLKLEAQLRQAQKMEAIGTLAGGIAHDFNNILSAVIGYAEMIQMFHKSEDPEVRRDVGEILRASLRAKDLVQQILTFSRRAEQDRRPIKLPPIIKESLKFLRASLPSTIEIHQFLDPEVGPVLADPTQMQQVVMNLCTNAAHAMQAKGGILEIRLSQAVIGKENNKETPRLTSGVYAHMQVQDNGHGIPADILGRIFDPYFTTKEMGEGTGLGLAVVEGIIRSHRGAITVESEPGIGTVFHVFIPLVERSEITLPTETHTLIPKGQGRVLFVDDESALANLGQEILENLGYEVEALTSSATALEHFRQQPQQYDLAILDLTMPQMTGVELARELLQIRPGLPIILASGSAEKIHPEEIREIGIREVIMKPWSVRPLAEAIKKVLG
ncbi:MAG: hybrid sensor histidine kinase/response regulator [Desulfobaccales bacterium]